MEVRTPADLPERIEVVKRRDGFERDPAEFVAEMEEARRRPAPAHYCRPQAPARTMVAARRGLGERGAAVHAVGHRRSAGRADADTCGARPGQLRTGATRSAVAHLRRVAPPALRHRLRRDPLDESGSSARVDRAVLEVFGADDGRHERRKRCRAWPRRFSPSIRGTGGVCLRSPLHPARDNGC